MADDAVLPSSWTTNVRAEPAAAARRAGRLSHRFSDSVSQSKGSTS